ncbi:MAG TPA: hypothetical protein PKA64_21815, partial [Myxococcota bacterium]|nr:hypothetical protein [Myxococcota bacterium]
APRAPAEPASLRGAQDGVIGDGDGEMGDDLTPISLPGGQLAVGVFGGDRHTCAVSACGALYCWGANSSGQLGMGDTGSRTTPAAPVLELDRYVAVDGADACVSTSGHAPVGLEVEAYLAGPQGALVCRVAHTATDADRDPIDYDIEWSRNGAPWGGVVTSYGLSGDAIALQDLTTGTYTCTVTATDGSLSSAPVSSAPLAVNPRTDLRLVDGSVNHTCVVLDAGLVKCVGDNGLGRLGINTNTAIVGDGAAEVGDGIAASSVGSPGRTPSEVATGLSHTCVLFDNGQVRCWGANSHGELGVGTTDTLGDAANEAGSESLNPTVDLGPDALVLQIGAGDAFTCARLDDGSVACWGENASGQLGTGDTDDLGGAAADLPIGRVDLGTGASAIDLAVGADHACALLDTGDIVCWGRNASGQLGVGDTADVGDEPGEMGDLLAPVDVSGVTVDLSAGGDTTCALSIAGAIRCWGANDHGQLGQSDTEARGDEPNELGTSLPAIALGTGRSALSVSASATHTCARLNDGSVRCWGLALPLGVSAGEDLGDEVGEMGDALIAVSVTGSPVISRVFSNDGTTCVVTECGQSFCFGSNSNGRLGVGSTLDRAIPGLGANNWGAARYLPVPGAEGLACNACTPTTTVYSYTGANQVVSVPAGCTHMSMKMWGAAGGGIGGGGGFSSGDLTLTPGTTLTVIVGGGGGRANVANGSSS